MLSPRELAERLGIERQPIRDTNAAGRQQQGEDKAMTTAAVNLVLAALGLLGTRLRVAAGEGVLGVLALLAVLGGVEDQDVKPGALAVGGSQQLLLRRGEQGGRGIGPSQPAQQPAGIADVGEDGAGG